MRALTSTYTCYVMTTLVQRDFPRMRCYYPFGPPRSKLAAFHRRKTDHAEIVSFLQGSSDGMMREKAEGEEKHVDPMC